MPRTISNQHEMAQRITNIHKVNDSIGILTSTWQSINGSMVILPPMSQLAFAHLSLAPPPASKDPSLPDTQTHTALLAALVGHSRDLLEQQEDTSEIVVQRDDVAGTEPRPTPRRGSRQLQHRPRFPLLHPPTALMKKRQ
jgi:hypothetical protein